MKNIIWKDVKGFEGVYKVNSLGEIWRIRYVGCNDFKKVRQINSTGQRIVVLSKSEEGVRTEKGHCVHTLIYDCFNKNRKHSLKFKDGNKNNLCINNMVENTKKAATNKGRLSQSVVDIMKKLRKEGKTYVNIGKLVGCSGQTVANYLKK